MNERNPTIFNEGRWTISTSIFLLETHLFVYNNYSNTIHQFSHRENYYTNYTRMPILRRNESSYPIMQRFSSKLDSSFDFIQRTPLNDRCNCNSLRNAMFLSHLTRYFRGRRIYRRINLGKYEEYKPDARNLIFAGFPRPGFARVRIDITGGRGEGRN